MTSTETLTRANPARDARLERLDRAALVAAYWTAKSAIARAFARRAGIFVAEARLEAVCYETERRGISYDELVAERVQKPALRSY